MIQDTFGRPFRDLRVSVTDRCNFRCRYCMPAEIYGERYEFLPREELLTFEEIARVVRVCVDLGAVKVRLTGGEPLVRRDLELLVADLAAVEGVEDLTLTTNAYLLPDKAAALREAGLHRVSVSLDTLDDEIFREMNGRGFGTEKVLEGIAAAESAGFHPIKVNAVVQRGVNDHTIVDLARHFKERGHIMRFIEYMDVGQPQRLADGPRRSGGRDRRPDRRRDAARAGGQQLPGRGRAALPVRRRRRGDRRHRVGDQAVLRRLHAPPPVAGGQHLHLPVLQQGHRPARPAAGTAPATTS